MTDIITKQASIIIDKLGLATDSVTYDSVIKALRSTISRTTRDGLIEKLKKKDNETYLSIKKLSDDLATLDLFVKTIINPEVKQSTVQFNPPATDDKLYQIDEADDFISGQGAAGDVGKLSWFNGGGGGIVQIDGVTTFPNIFHPGIYELATTAANGNVGVLSLQNTAATLGPLGISTLGRLVYVISPIEVTAYTRRYGILTLGTAADTDGVYFKEISTSGFFQCITRSGGVSTTTTTAVAVTTTNWYKLEIFFRDDSQIDFFINDILVGSHTTNIPTGVFEVGCAVVANAAAIKTVLIDYFRIQSRVFALASRWT